MGESEIEKEKEVGNKEEQRGNLSFSKILYGGVK